jgi:hypothetical protein
MLIRFRKIGGTRNFFARHTGMRIFLACGLIDALNNFFFASESMLKFFIVSHKCVVQIN